MTNDKKKPEGVFDRWYSELKESTKDIPDDDRFDEGLDKIISQFERGDYSSLDPELRKEIEEREEKRKTNKIAAKSRKKEITI